MSWIKSKSDGSKRLFNILTIVVFDDGNEVGMKETHKSVKDKNKTFIW